MLYTTCREGETSLTPYFHLDLSGSKHHTVLTGWPHSQLGWDCGHRLHSAVKPIVLSQNLHIENQHFKTI